MKKDRIVKIEPAKGWPSLNLHEILEYSSLLYFLTRRQIRVRYKQTFLGFLWALIHPITYMIVLTIFFGFLIRMPAGDAPYPLFYFSAILPWFLFSQGLNRAAQSTVSESYLIKKIYFPRLILPISSVIVPIVDFIFGFVFLILLMFYFGVTPNLRILLIPLLLGYAIISSLSVGLWFSALNAGYRDFGHIVEFLMTVWFFSSPVLYSPLIVPERFRIFFSINPMVGVIEGFRWILYGKMYDTAITGIGSILTLFSSVPFVLVVLVSGAYYYKRVEANLPDVL
jgi:lipopolysaccharide transport system permease protein